MRRSIRKNIKMLLEQKPDALMTGQAEFFGYNPNKPETLDAALVKQEDYFKSIRKFVNIDVESELRDFLYSPAGIAAIAGIDFMGGEPISIVLFSILVAYDIKKWIDMGEPNWLFLITDLICVSTAGFAGSAAIPLMKAAKNIKFKNLVAFFEYVSKFFKPIWEKFILPLAKSIEQVIGKVVQFITKIQKTLPSKLSSSVSNILSYLSKLGSSVIESLEKIIGKAGVKMGKTYAKYKTTSTLANQALHTDTGKEFLKNALPYINPLLGSDKLEPFLVDLVTSPEKIDFNNYIINPIFADNSKDTF